MAGGVLFSLGLAGVILRRDLIVVFMSLELMLNAANLVLVAFARFRAAPQMQAFVFFVILIAAVEAAVGLAIVVMFYRLRQTTNVEELGTMKH